MRVTQLSILFSLSACTSTMRTVDANCYAYRDCPEKLYTIAADDGMRQRAQDKGVSRPLRSTPQLYPRKAMQNGLEGWVIIEFDITPQGHTSNIKVVESEPPGYFEKTSIEAVKYYRYESSKAGYQGYQLKHRYVLDQ